MKLKIVMISMLLFICSVPVLSQDDMSGMIMPEEVRPFIIGGWASLLGKQAFSDDIPTQDYDNFQFNQADLNLYFIFNPHKDLSFFTEIAYSYLPGSVSERDLVTGRTTYFNNSASDMFSMQKEWGTIYIVRAYMEWHMFEFFQLRIGRMLTPFGIWSQDHGQTVITPIRPPSLLAPFDVSDSMPQSITGFEVLGKVNLGKVSDWGNAIFDYAIYVANNNTDLDSFGDNDTNWGKAFGLFLNFKVPVSILTFDVGGSYYRGKCIRLGYTDSSGIEHFNYNHLNNILLSHLKVSIQIHREVEFIAQGEFMYIWSEPGDKVAWNPNPYMLLGAPENYTLYGLYAMAELKFFSVFSVYYLLEDFKSENNSAFVNAQIGHSVGITIWPYPMMAIKFQYTRGHVKDADLTYVGEGYVDAVYTCIAMSF